MGTPKRAKRGKETEEVFDKIPQINVRPKPDPGNAENTNKNKWKKKPSYIYVYYFQTVQKHR